MIQFCLYRCKFSENYGDYEGWWPVSMFLTRKDAYNYFRDNLELQVNKNKNTIYGKLTNFSNVSSEYMSDYYKEKEYYYYSIGTIKIGDPIELSTKKSPINWFMRSYNWIESISINENPSELFLSRYYYNSSNRYCKEWNIKLKYLSDKDKIKYLNSLIYSSNYELDNILIEDSNTIIINTTHKTTKKYNQEYKLTQYSNKINKLLIDDSIKEVINEVNKLKNNCFSITTTLKIN
jgi:hypothetical protein